MILPPNRAINFRGTTRGFWLKVNRIILGSFLRECSFDRVTHRWNMTLGCASYGPTNWQKWLLGEKEGLEHIKFA